MLDIWFEVHAQTYHNAADVASGHYDVALTDHGREHARSVLRARYADQHFDIVFTSDTRRAYERPAESTLEVEAKMNLNNKTVWTRIVFTFLVTGINSKFVQL